MKSRAHFVLSQHETFNLQVAIRSFSAGLPKEILPDKLFYRSWDEMMNCPCIYFNLMACATWEHIRSELIYLPKIELIQVSFFASIGLSKSNVTFLKNT